VGNGKSEYYKYGGARPANFRPVVVLFLLEFSHILLALNMPHIHTSVVSSSNFQLIVIRALKTYNMRTKEDLFAHPLAAQLRDCDSPGAILVVLQEQVQVHNKSRRGHERVSHFLEPTVNLLHTFSLALEEGVGFVCFRTPTCF
jgi:hypothetical protein